MSKRNYNQYSNKKNHSEETEIDAIAETEVVDVVETPVAEPVVNEPAEVVETVTQPKKTPVAPKKAVGTVSNCTRLNIRAEANPSASVVCIVDVGAKVDIDTAKSTKEWLSVRTANGVTGYCMRKFVTVAL